MASRPKPVLTSAHRVVLRLAIDDRPGMFAEVARAVADCARASGMTR